MIPTDILKLLPHSFPFRFVDELSELSEDGITGHYQFRDDEYFYAGHFVDNPITPGVILVETMAQIGLACFGIYLLRDTVSEVTDAAMALSTVDVEFLLPVAKAERITVISHKEYFRFNKLKCRMEMRNSHNEIVCQGSLSGFVINNP